jgi:hypothetical protein
MDTQHLDTLRSLHDAAPERMLRFVIETVFREGIAAIPEMASKLEELLRMCVVDAARDELLAKISALETFQDGAYFTHVVAVQQAAGLLDPRVVSPWTRAAAAIETASYANAERVTGMHDDEVSTRWIEEQLEGCRTRVYAS